MIKIYLLLILSSSVLFAKTQKPSFDCKKAISKVETMICKDSDLSNADKSLANTFNDLMQVYKRSSINFEPVRISQKEWLKNRELCYSIGTKGEEDFCLKDTYKNRENFLKELINRPNSQDTGILHPFPCSVFSSWKVNGEKASKAQAERLYRHIYPQMDRCWNEISTQQQSKEYFVRNLMSLAKTAGQDCNAIASKFDAFVLSLDPIWSLGSDYIKHRNECLPNDTGFNEKLKHKVDSTKAAAENIFIELKAKLKNSPRQQEINKEHDHLVEVFSAGSLIEKLIEADRQKKYWSESLAVLKDLPKTCAKSEEGCLEIKIGKMPNLITLQIHFEPTSNDQATIKEIEVVDKNSKRPVKIAEEITFSSLDSWALEASDCFQDGDLYLAIGHSTARFPYWDAYYFDHAKSELIQNKQGCTVKDE